MFLSAKFHIRPFDLLIDSLLPVSLLLFLLPLNPLLSTYPAVAFVVFRLAFASPDRRWATWPLLFAILLFSRSWWLNQTIVCVRPVAGLLEGESCQTSAALLC